MDQTLVTIGLVCEVALAATAERREALVDQHRADEIADGVLGHGARPRPHSSRRAGRHVICNEFVRHEEDPPQLAGHSQLGSGLPSFPRMAR